MQVKHEAENSQKKASELAAKELDLSKESARQDALKKELNAGEIMITGVLACNPELQPQFQAEVWRASMDMC